MGCRRGSFLGCHFDWLTLYEITQKGRLILQDLGYKIQNTSEGIAHRFWKYKISDFYKSQGFNVLVEQYINGRPDIIIKKYRKKIAIEIETGKSDFLRNIKRGLDSGFDEVICVGTTRFVEDKIQDMLKKHGIVDDRLKVTNVMGF